MLAQIELRTDVLTLAGDGFDLFIINQPGSYYLTTNILVGSGINGITITTNNVTLELNGFTISSTAASCGGKWDFVKRRSQRHHHPEWPHPGRRDEQRQWRV